MSAMDGCRRRAEDIWQRRLAVMIVDKYNNNGPTTPTKGDKEQDDDTLWFSDLVLVSWAPIFRP